MKKNLLLLLCVIVLTNVPTFSFSGTSHLQKNSQYVEYKNTNIFDEILKIFDKNEKIYHNADFV